MYNFIRKASCPLASASGPQFEKRATFYKFGWGDPQPNVSKHRFNKKAHLIQLLSSNKASPLQFSYC